MRCVNVKLHNDFRFHLKYDDGRLERTRTHVQIVDICWPNIWVNTFSSSSAKFLFNYPEDTRHSQYIIKTRADWRNQKEKLTSKMKRSMNILTAMAKHWSSLKYRLAQTCDWASLNCVFIASLSLSLSLFLSPGFSISSTFILALPLNRYLPPISLSLHNSPPFFFRPFAVFPASPCSLHSTSLLAQDWENRYLKISHQMPHLEQTN